MCALFKPCRSPELPSSISGSRSRKRFPGNRNSRRDELRANSGGIVCFSRAIIPYLLLRGKCDSSAVISVAEGVHAIRLIVSWPISDVRQYLNIYYYKTYVYQCVKHRSKLDILPVFARTLLLRRYVWQNSIYGIARRIYEGAVTATSYDSISIINFSLNFATCVWYEKSCYVKWLHNSEKSWYPFHNSDKPRWLSTAFIIRYVPRKHTHNVISITYITHMPVPAYSLCALCFSYGLGRLRNQWSCVLEQTFWRWVGVGYR